MASLRRGMAVASGTSKRAHRRVALLVAALAFVTPLGAGGQSTEVPNSAYFGGGGVIVQGNLKLSFTLGEPAAGPTSNGSTRVIAGFQATFLPPETDVGNCSIFCDGFEQP